MTSLIKQMINLPQIKKFRKGNWLGALLHWIVMWFIPVGNEEKRQIKDKFKDIKLLKGVWPITKDKNEWINKNLYVMRGRGEQASSCLNWWVLRTSPLKLASHIRDPGRAQKSRGGWPTNNPLFWGKKQAPYSPSRSLFPTRQNFSLKTGKGRNRRL